MQSSSFSPGIALQNFPNTTIANSPSRHVSHTGDPYASIPRAAPLHQPGHSQTNISQSFHPARALLHPIHLAQRHRGGSPPTFAQQTTDLPAMSRPTQTQIRPTRDRRVALPLAGTMQQTRPARHQGPVQSTESSPERPAYFQVPSPISYNPHLTALRPTWYREHHLSDLTLEMQVSATSREEYHHPRNEMHESPPHGGGREYHLHGSVPGTRVSATSREDYCHSPARPVVRLPARSTLQEQAGDMYARRGAEVQEQPLVYGQRSQAPVSSSIPQGHSHSPDSHSVRPQQSTHQLQRYKPSHPDPPATHPQNHQAYHTNQRTHPLPARPPPPSNIHDPIYQSYPFRLFPLGHHGRPSPPVAAPPLNRSTPAANSALPQQHLALLENWRERSWRVQDQQQHRQSR
ncbi:hypothetical protein BDV97DRAFT_346018 [Delphinella strobiligena]|nr:hypothetical protein BDV97DRAFT_346018 [Delphinella strobiligena]